MKILRLFVNSHLDDPVNWSIIDNNEITDSGSSLITELTQFNDVQLEVFLSASCCSILKVSVEGITNKRLTDELVLGMLEENFVDEIEEVKPIILRVEDDIAYVAIFNHEYYMGLIEALTTLNKTILFVQSFVFTTTFSEGSWTVFLDQDYSFIRTSKYEYFLLDDNRPLPTLLTDMLENSEEKPESLIIYSNTTDHNIPQLIEANFKIKCVDANGQLAFDNLVWNFYNQKSTKFKIKLKPQSKTSLLKLFKTLKYFAACLFIFWILEIFVLTIKDFRIESQITSELKNMVAVSYIGENMTKLAREKIVKLRHERGIYDETDAVALFSIFLDIIPDVSSDKITQIDYASNQLKVFLTSQFSTVQFASYRNIFATKNIVAEIQSYRDYSRNNKDDNSSSSAEVNQPQISDNTAWVITLRPAFANVSTITSGDSK